MLFASVVQSICTNVDAKVFRNIHFCARLDERTWVYAVMFEIRARLRR